MNLRAIGSPPFVFPYSANRFKGAPTPVAGLLMTAGDRREAGSTQQPWHPYRFIEAGAISLTKKS